MSCGLSISALANTLATLARHEGQDHLPRFGESVSFDGLDELSRPNLEPLVSTIGLVMNEVAFEPGFKLGITQNEHDESERFSVACLQGVSPFEGIGRQTNLDRAIRNAGADQVDESDGLDHRVSFLEEIENLVTNVKPQPFDSLEFMNHDVK